MKHKYRNYYFPVLICIFSVCAFFLSDTLFLSGHKQMLLFRLQKSDRVFLFWIPLILNFQSCATEIWIILPFSRNWKTERISILTGSLLYPICRFKTVLSKTAIPYRIWSVPEIFIHLWEYFCGWCDRSGGHLWSDGTGSKICTELL